MNQISLQDAQRKARQIAAENRLSKTQRLVLTHMISCGSPAIIMAGDICYGQDCRVPVPRATHQTFVAMREKGVLVAEPRPEYETAWHGGPRVFKNKFRVNPALLD